MILKKICIVQSVYYSHVISINWPPTMLKICHAYTYFNIYFWMKKIPIKRRKTSLSFKSGFWLPLWYLQTLLTQVTWNINSWREVTILYKNKKINPVSILKIKISSYSIECRDNQYVWSEKGRSPNSFTCFLK
jgi:hypothetical protein